MRFRFSLREFWENEDGFLGLAISAIGSLIGGVGKKKQGSAEAQAYTGQATAADKNAEFLQKRTAMELLLQGRAGTRATGSTNAAIGASGFSGAGSAGDIIRQNARDIAFDAESIRVAGEAAVEQERLKASGYRLAAKGAKTAGTIGLAGGIFDAATTLFGGRG